MSNKTFKPGDWMESMSRGLWQVYRILALDGMTLVFSKRFVSASYKKAFAEEVCNARLVNPLEPEKLAELQAFIAKEAALHAKFRAYTPKPLDALLNLGVLPPAAPGDTEAAMMELEAKLAALLPLPAAALADELKRLGLEPNTTPARGWKVQFVSPDHMTDAAGTQLVYRFAQILR
ncbi:hypothetical protein DB346_18880 [Verrucomicrobia bacterium LW23]|nr:hypothetical protein DB346_18880 [Verrucomicrobia bacterium LW23]